MSTLNAQENYLFQELRKKRMNQADVLGDFTLKSLTSGTSDIYPDPAHFVYELLQNADDAEATEVSFYLTNDTLIFKHNGSIHFTITEDREDVRPWGHINAITAYFPSKAAESNRIGKFGLGFKSVYNYTDTPTIYDDKFKFYIERRMVPSLIEKDHPMRHEGETLFVFPLKNKQESASEISKKISSLEYPTLFLNHLKKITFEDRVNNETKLFDKTVHYTGTKGDIQYEELLINDAGVLKMLLLFKRKVSIPDIGDQEISVGYFFNNDGTLDVQTERGIYCFFPTKESFDLCFISHAPFLLTNNRQNLNDNKINRDFIIEISKLAADALPLLRDYGIEKGQNLLDDNLFYIAPYHYYDTHRGYVVYDENLITAKYFLNYIKNLLYSEPLLLSTTGKYVLRKNAYVFSNKDLGEVVGDSEIKKLRNNVDAEIVQIDNSRRQKMLDFLEKGLNLNIYSPESFASDITSGFMESQDSKWVIRFYKYLLDDAPVTWNPSNSSSSRSLPMRYAPIIYSHKNEWIPPYLKQDPSGEIHNVYLPIGSCNGTYNFINDIYYNKDVDEKVKEFYKKLGLKTPDALDYIKQQILPKYALDTVNLPDDEVRNDFYTLYQIVNDKENEERKGEIIGVIKKQMWFKGTDLKYFLPTSLYSPTADLLLYFEGNRDVTFVNIDYYLDKRKYVEKTQIQQFFETMGVWTVSCVKIYKKAGVWDLPDWQKEKLGYFAHSSIGEVIDYDLDGLSYLINKGPSLEQSKLIWIFLAERIWDIEKFLEGYVEYTYYSRKRKHFPSSLYNNLFSRKWLYNIDGQLCEVKDVYIEDLLIQGYPRENYLFELLKIRSRGKTIKELGGTEEQQRQQELGAYAEKLGLTKEHLERLVQKEKEEQLREASRNQSDSGSTESSDREPLSYGPAHDTRENGNLDDMFDGNTSHERSVKLKETEATSNEDSQKRIEDLKQKLEEDGNKKLEREMLRQQAEELPKYTRDWFLYRLQLEYEATSETDASSGIRRSVSISFGKIVFDKDNNRLCELRSPSRDIPLWIEEIENLKIDFLFNNRDELTCSFEVANVRDYSLRLKVKASDADSFSSIDWSKFTKADINVNNPIDLVNNFRKAFKNLLLPDGYNLKEHLRDNISFVFGPPGTGKTTHLAKKIIDSMNSKRNKYRILVLAPTNKACDVLVKKIMELDDSYTWLGRFVTTGETEIEDMGVVCDRDSTLYSEDKCCIVSTMARLPYDGFIGTTGYKQLKDIDWDLVICDEASMIPIAQIVYAIYQFKMVPFVIAGDPMQIPPIDVTNIWDSENIYDMVELKSFDNPVTSPIQFKIENLETQYRAVPAIGGLFSDYAYGGMLKHHWTQQDQLPLNIKELHLKSVNYVPFRVESYDSMFSAKKLSNSAIHIYSALLSTEFCRYISKKYVKENPDAERLDIGIICPYASQAQLIQRMLEQMQDLPSPELVNITTGTIHSFQGDQCNIVFAVFNPPVGLKYERAAELSHINNQNIINVAISRAKDYLFILLPDKNTCKGYDNLFEIKRLGSISATKYREETCSITASEIEKVVFGSTNFLEGNTFVTSHQLANVYTQPVGLYEIRVDENSVDIQIGNK